MSIEATGHQAKHEAASRELSSADFFELVAVNSQGSIQGVVFPGRSGQLTDHVWNRREKGHGEWAAQKVYGRKPAYFTCAAYDPQKVSDYKGRAAANVTGLRGFWLDVEGSKEKGGYEGGPAVLAAVGKFIRSTKCKPNAIVSTGSGGVHLHYVLDTPISREAWQPRAAALVELAKRQGFRIDAQCTTDAARVMRAPGSVHQKTGEAVKARQLNPTPYTLDQLDQLWGHDPAAAEPPAAGTSTRHNLSINGDVLGGQTEYSFTQAARHCGAMRQAIEDKGASTPYPVWILALRTAELSTEGREFAHQISEGHSNYDEVALDDKLRSLTGGPAGCAAWAVAYGEGGPCDSCEFKERIKNPAIQLGGVTDTTPPGTAATDSMDAPEWVSELNKRFAVARVGSRMAVVDFLTPAACGNGTVRGFGYLDMAAFHAMFNGRFAPLENPKERPRPISSAWLAHPHRKQYEAVIYAPGEVLADDILNTWRGFAVPAVPGDVQPWLDVLAALVPSEIESKYVLNWLAWKVQNPGGVPDTILIFRGAKGTGKNSLFDPLIAAFGKHAMLADDPELIAGRFTGHLMSLSFAVLDEAVFVGDPRQADRIKSRVTAKVMHYEQKGMDPVSGKNRCAYVMLTNHSHVWQATGDERRAVVVDVGEALRGNLEFWDRYHLWAGGNGSSALLQHLQGINLQGFNPRQIPRGESLRKQIELTALRDPAAAWWHQCLSEGAIQWRSDGERVVRLGEADTEIDRAGLRLSFEQSAAAKGRAANDWAAVSRKLVEWSGPGGVKKIRKRIGTDRGWFDVLAPLSVLKAEFTQKTQVRFDGPA